MLAVEGLALVSLWVADMPWCISLVLSLVLIPFAIWSNYRHVFLCHPLSVETIRFQSGCWYLGLVDKRYIEVKLKGEVLLTPFVIALTLQEMQWPRKSFPLVIFRDALSFDSHRRLRVFLKLLTARGKVD